MLLQGRSGITAIENWDTEGYSTRFAGEIKEFSAAGYVSKKMERRMDNCIKYTIVAGKKARAVPLWQVIAWLPTSFLPVNQ